MVCLAVAVALASCTRSAEGQMPSPEMISDALPTITEMPGKWNESQRQVFTQRSPENPSIDPSIWCPDAAEVTRDLIDLAGQSGADVEMQAVTVNDSPRLMRLQAWANDDVEAYFGDASEAVRVCDGATVTDSDGVTTTYGIVEARDIGDESISWAQTVEPPASAGDQKMSSVGRTTIARFGDIVMVLQIGDIVTSAGAPLMDEEQWWSIVELAGGKLDDLDEQVHD
jgi:hypothetical protein